MGFLSSLLVMRLVMRLVWATGVTDPTRTNPDWIAPLAVIGFAFALLAHRFLAGPAETLDLIAEVP